MNGCVFLQKDSKDFRRYEPLEMLGAKSPVRTKTAGDDARMIQNRSDTFVQTCFLFYVQAAQYNCCKTVQTTVGKITIG